MLFNTPNQFVVLLLMLVIGWLFGLASHSGGRRWKQALRDEQVARAEERAKLETQIVDLRADRDSARATASSVSAASAARPAVPRAPRRDQDR